MVGIQGIGGVPEPKPDRPANTRDNSKAPKSGDSESTDNVAISSQAQAAAVVAKALQVSDAATDIRTERVEEAKAALERGDYKDPDVVSTVADRLSKFL